MLLRAFVCQFFFFITSFSVPFHLSLIPLTWLDSRGGLMTQDVLGVVQHQALPDSEGALFSVMHRSAACPPSQLY